jgi:hypothetical protein
MRFKKPRPSVDAKNVKQLGPSYKFPNSSEIAVYQYLLYDSVGPDYFVAPGHVLLPIPSPVRGSLVRVETTVNYSNIVHAFAGHEP